MKQSEYPWRVGCEYSLVKLVYSHENEWTPDNTSQPAWVPQPQHWGKKPETQEGTPTTISVYTKQS